MGGNWGVQRRIRSDIQSIQTLPLFPGPPCHPRSTSVEDIYQASLWSRTCFIQPQSHPAPWNRLWCIKSPFHDSDNNNWNCNKSWIWCIMCSIIFPLDTAKNKKKPRSPRRLIDPCPAEHSEDAHASLKAESSLSVFWERRHFSEVVGVCLAAVQSFDTDLVIWWMGGCKKCTCKGSLSPSHHEKECFVAGGEQRAQVLPTFDVNTVTGGNPPTCIHPDCLETFLWFTSGHKGWDSGTRQKRRRLMQLESEIRHWGGLNQQRLEVKFTCGLYTFLGFIHWQHEIFIMTHQSTQFWLSSFFSLTLL